MAVNPRGDWSIGDVAALCSGLGIDCTPPRGGSHYKVKHPRILAILTIPAHRPIKTVYIRALLAFIDDVERSGS